MGSPRVASESSSRGRHTINRERAGRGAERERAHVRRSAIDVLRSRWRAGRCRQRTPAVEVERVGHGALGGELRGCLTGPRNDGVRAQLGCAFRGERRRSRERAGQLGRCSSLDP